MKFYATLAPLSHQLVHSIHLKNMSLTAEPQTDTGTVEYKLQQAPEGLSIHID